MKKLIWHILLLSVSFLGAMELSYEIETQQFLSDFRYNPIKSPIWGTLLFRSGILKTWYEFSDDPFIHSLFYLNPSDRITFAASIQQKNPGAQLTPRLIGDLVKIYFDFKAGFFDEKILKIKLYDLWLNHTQKPKNYTIQSFLSDEQKNLFYNTENEIRVLRSELANLALATHIIDSIKIKKNILKQKNKKVIECDYTHETTYLNTCRDFCKQRLGQCIAQQRNISSSISTEIDTKESFVETIINHFCYAKNTEDFYGYLPVFYLLAYLTNKFTEQQYKDDYQKQVLTADELQKIKGSDSPLLRFKTIKYKRKSASALQQCIFLEDTLHHAIIDFDSILHPFPEIIPGWATVRKHTFPDCVETALRKFIICLLWDVDKQSLRSGIRQEVFGRGVKKLAEYLTIYNTRQQLESTPARNAWALLISDLKNASKTESLIFKNNTEHYSCELLAKEGFSNIWRALDLLINVSNIEDLKRFLSSKGLCAEVTFVPFKHTAYGMLILDFKFYNVILQIDEKNAVCFVQTKVEDTQLVQRYKRLLEELEQLGPSFNVIKNFCMFILKPVSLLRNELLSPHADVQLKDFDIQNQLLVYHALHVDNPQEIPSAVTLAMRMWLRNDHAELKKLLFKIISSYYGHVLDSDIHTRVASITKILDEIEIYPKVIDQYMRDFIYNGISQLNQKYTYAKSSELLKRAQEVLKKEWLTH